jgi:putative ABC transport system permease protein
VKALFPALRNYHFPLAWYQLAGEKLRLIAAVAGIAFAVIMMMMQLGFHDALFDSTTLLHHGLDGELTMVSRQYECAIATKGFTRRRLYQALALPAVQSVAPVYLGLGKWKNPETLRDRDIFVIGVNPADPSIRLTGVAENVEHLKIEDALLFDRASRPEYGPIAPRLTAGEQLETELNTRRVHVRGLFRMGTSFAADGNVIMSDVNFLRFFPNRPPGMIELGLIRLQEGADPRTVRDQLESGLPEDVRILTREEYLDLEHAYWGQRTPIGFVITAGLLIGFVVGSVIVYQILYTDVIDHLKEYATLKAIGYSDRFLFGVVLQQAIILSVLGFIPGCLAAAGIFFLTRRITLLPAYLTLDRAALVFLLTLLMCSIAGAFAIRKLRSADPADIF